MTNSLGRRLAALGLLASGSVAAVMFIAPSPVSAQAPDVVAWWNSTNLGDPAPTPPAPPDVKDGDLLVQGSNPAAAGAPTALPNPLAAAPVTTQAVAGVAFDLPAAALVGALTLQIDGTPPPQVSVVACRAKERFTATENGPWSEVPPYDGDACVAGALKGSAVVFKDVSKLVLHDTLAVLLLPGPVDRVVFKPPNSKALAVSSSGGVGAAAPPIGAGSTGSTTVGGGAGSSGTAAVGGTSVAAPPTADLPSGDAGTVPPTGTDQAPLVAGSGTGTPAAQSTPAATSSGLSTRDRRIIALAVIAAEVIGYVLLMRSRAPEVAPAGTAAVVAGGRLRPPDRWSASAGAGGHAGVGRFRSERQGPTPHL